MDATSPGLVRVGGPCAVPVVESTGHIGRTVGVDETWRGQTPWVRSFRPPGWPLRCRRGDGRGLAGAARRRRTSSPTATRQTTPSWFPRRNRMPYARGHRGSGDAVDALGVVPLWCGENVGSRGLERWSGPIGQFAEFIAGDSSRRGAVACARPDCLILLLPLLDA
jgi:hypothetical protein